MTILTFMSGFYRAIQFSDAEEIGSGGSGFIGTIYFRADSTALLIGHILFANASVGLWPFSTVAVFIVLFVKAHYKDKAHANAIDDEVSETDK